MEQGNSQDGYIGKLKDWTRKVQSYEVTDSIHSSQSVRFAENVIGYKGEQLKVLKNGLHIKADIKATEKYRDKNNKSVMKNREVFGEQVEEWLRDGKIIELEEVPNIINPMSIVEKYDGRTKKTKYRVCIDQSRFVNKRIEDRKCKLETLAEMEQFFEQDIWVCTFDLVQMYHQIHLDEESQSWFCFEERSEEGEVRYFKGLRLMFGNKEAVQAVTKLLRPVICFFRSIGIKIFMYIDDGTVLNRDRRVLLYEIRLVIETLRRLGWKINYGKSELDPVKEVLIQGLWLNTERLEYKAPVWKVEDIGERIDRILENKGEVPARELGSVTGKLAALDRAFGKIVKVGLRRTHHLLGGAVILGGSWENPNWEATVSLDWQSLEELRLVRRHITERNGARVQNMVEKVIIKAGKSRFGVQLGHNLEEEYTVMVSDASDEKAFIFEAEEFKLVKDWAFDKMEREMGSGRRELRAVKNFLNLHRTELEKCEKKIFWITDSQNLFYFLRRGSRQKDIQRDIVEIKVKEHELGISIIPIWTPRETQEIVWADLGSKQDQSTDEWGVCEKDFRKIQDRLRTRFTVDGFATKENKKCEKFFSKFPQVNCAGIDFFSQEMKEEESYWLCPPVKLVPKTIDCVKAMRGRVRAAVALPDWKGHACYLAARENGGWLKEVSEVITINPFFKTYNRASSVFQGKTNFGLIILMFRPVEDNRRRLEESERGDRE